MRAAPGRATSLGLRKFIVEPAAPRILAYLNISFPGIFGFSKTVMVGECEDLRLLDSRECLALAEKNLDLIVGIKARVGARRRAAVPALHRCCWRLKWPKNLTCR